MRKVALCADVECLQNPELLGLDGERLDSQAWLEVFDDARDARQALLQSAEIAEAWVVSNCQIDPINLAAALKKDRPLLRVVLFSDDCSGSLKSRAAHAGVDATLSGKDLTSLYATRKAEAMRLAKTSTKEQSETIENGENEILLAEAPDQPKKGLLVPIVSGSGGVGKSTLCALLGLVAQRKGISTLILDLDLQFGDLCELLGYENTLSVDEVLASPQRFDQVRRSDDLPSLLAPPQHVDQAEPLAPYVPELLQRARAAYDLVLVNTGGFWTEQHIHLLEQCDRALFVIDQRPSALRSCRKALDLCTRCGVAASPFSVVVNRCSKTALYTSIDASCALHGMPAFEIKDGGSNVEELTAASRMEELLSTKAPVVESVQDLLVDLFPLAKSAALVDEREQQGPVARLLRGLVGKAG